MALRTTQGETSRTKLVEIEDGSLLFVPTRERSYGFQDYIDGELNLILALKETDVADRKYDISTARLYRMKGQTPIPYQMMGYLIFALICKYFATICNYNVDKRLQKEVVKGRAEHGAGWALAPADEAPRLFWQTGPLP